MKQILYVMTLYLLMAAIFDSLKRKVPNWISYSALLALGGLMAFRENGIYSVGLDVIGVRLSYGIGVYLLFFVFYNFGMFGGADGKAAALITIVLGIEVLGNIMLVASVFAIGYGLFKLRKIGYGKFFFRMMKLLKLIGFSDREGFREELALGLQLPFLPFVFMGYLFYEIALKGGIAF